MMFRNKNSKTYIEKHDEMLFEERMTYEYSCSEVIGLYFDASDAWKNLPDRDRKEYRGTHKGRYNPGLRHRLPQTIR